MSGEVCREQHDVAVCRRRQQCAAGSAGSVNVEVERACVVGARYLHRRVHEITNEYSTITAFEPEH
ncbi:MAG: hypothetical protein JWR37_4461 [Mycobacterium sp.]|nr:hypothetical protein [Mycobacterium sp.]